MRRKFTIMKDFDIIYYTLFPTDNIYSSVSLSLAKEFSKNNRVFYVNKPYSLKDFFGNLKNEKVKERAPKMLSNQVHYETISKIPENFLAATPPLTLPINWLPKGKVHQSLHKYNRSVVIKAVQKLISDFKIKKYIYLNCFNPYGAAVLPKELNAALNIYQCIDDISQDEYTVRHGFNLENRAIKEADVTLVTSTQLWNLKSKISPNTHILHNAVDQTVFKRALEEQFDRPKELSGKEGKVIGFIGNLDHLRINYHLLKKAAIHHRDKTFLLVGPLNNTEYLELGLDKLPNVIFAGGKNLYELPQYLQHMDCTLIPFKCNTVTASIYPLKINEYLTAGKAVVATNFSEDIRSFSKHVFLADSEESFVQLIDKALIPQTDQQIQGRVQLAAANTWTARVKEFWDIVDQYV